MKIKKAKELAKRQAKIAVSWVDVPQVGDYINPDIDYWGLGKQVTSGNKWEYFELLCEHAAYKGFYNLTEKQQNKISGNEELQSVYDESVLDVITKHVVSIKES